MIDRFLELSPYSLGREEKRNMLLDELKELTAMHEKKCKEYRWFLETLGYDHDNIHRIEDIPFFPVRLFKDYDLLSIDRKEVFKTMTSSGTSGQAVSKIYVDKETAMLQQKVMLRILGDFWGKKRLPMLIVDSPSIIKDRNMFSARGAAILGLRIAAREMVFTLNEDMSLNTDVLDGFLEKNGDGPFIIFGFTFLVWQHFYKAITARKTKCDMSKAWLMTGGGWKKLESEAVSGDDFKKALNDRCGIVHFLDHYGMVEQTGCIYAECEYGHLHASIFSDVIVRDYRDFSPLDIGERGIIQVVSVLPHSYPGHSLITEDEGMILGEDDCPCGRKGKYIRIFGRLKNAELRGCSDTYADKFR